jgi:hypothetical protein
MIPDAVPNQACGRSTGNYAHLVAADLGLELTDVSCIGATIDNVTTTPAAPDVDSAAINNLLDQVENKLVAMLGKVQQAAPAARIYLIARPMVLPDPAVPCPPDVPIQPADATFFGEVGARLQAAFSSAAATTGVNFVDVYGPSHGHDACAPADQRWVEGQANPAVAAYHPNAAGMRAQADLIVAEIRKTN